VFLFRKKNKPKRLLQAQIDPAQKRASFRMPVDFEVAYKLHDRDELRHGRASDISGGGLRLLTDEDLLQGSLLDIDFCLPSDFLSELSIDKEVFEQTPFGPRPASVKTTPPPFQPMHITSVICSTSHISELAQFAYGMKFLGLNEHTEEELERFVHLGQLHEIRVRTGQSKQH
jgi:c-di-GMP-binding flagellar brake protein YcgR